MEPEIWKPVVGFEGRYEVSDKGRVRSVLRNKVLALIHTHKGYSRVNLSVDGRRTQIEVHRLVAAAFIGPCPTGQEVCHEDGDGQHNHVANLRYGDRVANCADKRRHGRLRQGCDVHNAKLTPAAIRSIRAVRGKETLGRIAARYGVSVSAVHHAQSGRTWRHV